MPLSDARKRANAKYASRAYEQVMFRVYKGQKAVIQAYAKEQGQSLNGYIYGLIKKDMGAALLEDATKEQTEQQTENREDKTGKDFGIDF